MDTRGINRNAVSICLLAIGLFTSTIANSAVYKCIDENNKPTFSDRPCADDAVRIDKLIPEIEGLERLTKENVKAAFLLLAKYQKNSDISKIRNFLHVDAKLSIDLPEEMGGLQTYSVEEYLRSAKGNKNKNNVSYDVEITAIDIENDGYSARVKANIIQVGKVEGQRLQLITSEVDEIKLIGKSLRITKVTAKLDDMKLL